jgi:hypothetical protein
MRSGAGALPTAQSAPGQHMGGGSRISGLLRSSQAWLPSFRGRSGYLSVTKKSLM